MLSTSLAKCSLSRNRLLLNLSIQLLLVRRLVFQTPLWLTAERVLIRSSIVLRYKIARTLLRLVSRHQASPFRTASYKAPDLPSMVPYPFLLTRSAGGIDAQATTAPAALFITNTQFLSNTGTASRGAAVSAGRTADLLVYLSITSSRYDLHATDALQIREESVYHGCNLRGLSHSVVPQYECI